MADKPKPEVRFIATNAAHYWGAHRDGPHHAIVECMQAGADSGDVFVVYEAYDGCYIDDMGGTVYLVEHGNPFEKPEGVYDGLGNWMGETLLEIAKECHEDRYRDWAAERPHISKATIASLKRHYQQSLEEAN